MSDIDRMTGMDLDCISGDCGHDHEAAVSAAADPEPPLHGHNIGGDWIECTDEHPRTPGEDR